MYNNNMTQRDEYRALLDAEYSIYYKRLDDPTDTVSVYTKTYKYYGNAIKVMNRLFGDPTQFEAVVSKRNPWIEYFSEVTCDTCGKKFKIRVTADGSTVGNYMFINTVNINGDCLNERGYMGPIENIKKYGSSFGFICDDCMKKIVNTIDSLKDTNKE